jgi:HK97 family phage portal protein
MSRFMDSLAKVLRRGREPAPVERVEPSAALMWGGINWDDWVRGNIGATVGVNEKTALGVAAVTACVNLIAGSMASMPVHLYRRKPDGDREAYKSDLWWLLNERAMPNWSSAAFWEYMAAARLFHGDAIAIIHRDKTRISPVPVGLEPVHPLYQVADIRRVGDILVYDLLDTEGKRLGSFHQDDILHVSGPGFNGRRSLSQLQFGLRHAAGIASVADSQAASFIGDGARPDWAIEVPGKMDNQQIDALQRTFKERNSGQSSSRTPVVMSGGMKLHQLTLSSEDAELLSTRGFQIEEICRVFGVPPFMIGHTEKTTSWGSGVEQMSIGFVKYTLQRHLVAFEQELNFKFFKTSRNFAEFVTAGLERGDTKTRFESYRIALGRAGEPAWMKAKEIRRLENLPDDPDFDKPLSDPNEAPPQTAG